MKTLDVTHNPASLQEAVHALNGEPMAVLHNGQPVAVLLPVKDADLETVALSLNPEFLAILERSKTRQLAEGGVSGEEMRRRLEVHASGPGKAKGGRKAAPKRP